MNNFWRDKTVLVTGAGGFIGSQLVEALLRQGARVRALVRYNSRGDAGLLRFLPASLIQFEAYCWRPKHNRWRGEYSTWAPARRSRSAI